jgi:rod shape determining protein RodA
MMNKLLEDFKRVDFTFFVLPLFLTLFSLTTLFHFNGDNSLLFKQIIINLIGIIFFYLCLKIDFSFLRQGNFIFIFYFFSILVLILLLLLGTVTNNAQSWFKIFGISFQPVELAKLSLIFLLAKYFDKRHVQIAYYPNIIISFFYAFILFTLTLKQPDLGSALVIMFIWVVSIFVSGIPKKYLIILFILASSLSFFAWQFALKDYQKARITTFIYPEQDRLGSGYNVYQAQIAIGSGGLFGKGISLGTQSNLSYLPEYETDFIFGAFAEEWGFVGSVFLILIFCFLIFKIAIYSTQSNSNFETLFMIGVIAYLFIHFVINVGMNLGVIPVTGIPLPFVSAGGTHIILEWIMLGVVMSMHIKSKQFQGKYFKVKEFDVI